MTDKPNSEDAPAAVSGPLLDQLAEMLWLPDDLGGAAREARMRTARALLADMAPAPGVEGLIAVQMVAAHMAAMDCFGRAADRDAGEAARERSLVHAERLLALCARQADAIGRHRAREDKRREQAERAEQAKKAQQPPGDWAPVRIRRIIFDPKEWWGVRAHVFDPRVVLARRYAEADARLAGMDEAQAMAEGEWAAREAAADLPTVDGKPYIVDDKGMRHYPLPNGELAKVMAIDEEPFDAYFDRVGKEDGEEAERRAREISARNDALPNNPWRRDYRPKPRPDPKTNGAAAPA